MSERDFYSQSDAHRESYPDNGRSEDDFYTNDQEYSSPDDDAEAVDAAYSARSLTPLRGVAMILIALAVVLFLWLFFWQVHSRDTSASSGAVASTATSTETAPGTPEATTATSAVAASPVSDPKTVSFAVLNNSTIQGLAARVGDSLRAEGWSVAQVGNWADTVIDQSTVFYTGGNADEENAAKELAAQLHIQSAVRTEDIATAPAGMVVILTGEV